MFVFCRELLDKKATQSVANNINYRHRMAQYASRASVNLHTHIFFRNQRRDETGYVLFVRQNAIQASDADFWSFLKCVWNNILLSCRS